jgi:hypothetical protein
MSTSEQKTYTEEDLVQWYARGYKNGLNNAANKAAELIQSLIDEYENPSEKAVAPHDVESAA